MLVETFVFLFILGLIFLLAISLLSKKLNSDDIPPSKTKLNQNQQAVVNSVQRLVDIINESLKIANESNNADTKVSRLDVAKQKLNELKRLSEEHTFIQLTQLPQVEQSIEELDQEFMQAHYRTASEGNLRGQALEKEGNVDEAITEYERLLEKNVDTPFTYRRLAIIYSKRKERDEELRVLKAAIKNVPIENSSHYQWFAERLAKKTKTNNVKLN